GEAGRVGVALCRRVQRVEGTAGVGVDEAVVESRIEEVQDADKSGPVDAAHVEELLQSQVHGRIGRLPTRIWFQIGAEDRAQRRRVRLPASQSDDARYCEVVGLEPGHGAVQCVALVPVERNLSWTRVFACRRT